MDYHAWMILMRSLEYKDYAEETNREIANPGRPGSMAAGAARLIHFIRGRLRNDRQNMEQKTAARNEPGCHAC
jgi:hypothetical protein